MMRQTGGRASGATSTRSRPCSSAISIARSIGMIPTCSPSGLITRTGLMRIWRLTRSFSLMARLRWGRGNKNGPEGSGPFHRKRTHVSLPWASKRARFRSADPAASRPRVGGTDRWEARRPPLFQKFRGKITDWGGEVNRGRMEFAATTARSPPSRTPSAAPVRSSGCGFGFRFGEKLEEGVEGLLAMMIFLAEHVLADQGDVPLGHGKGTVGALPLEVERRVDVVVDHVG